MFPIVSNVGKPGEPAQPAEDAMKKITTISLFYQNKFAEAVAASQMPRRHEERVRWAALARSTVRCFGPTG